MLLVRVAVTVLLAFALVGGTPATAPAYDVDAEFVESFRAEQLRFGRGGRAFVWVEQSWQMDQLHWLDAHPTPIWHACVIVWYRTGEGEEGCSGPRMRSASIDPLLRSAAYSFSMRLPAERPWQVELHTRERAANRRTQRVVPRPRAERTDRPSVTFTAEGGAWTRDSRPQITRGWIRTPSGRHLKLRTADDRGGRLVRFVRGSTTTGRWTIGRPHIEIPPPVPPLPQPPPCLPTC